MSALATLFRSLVLGYMWQNRLRSFITLLAIGLGIGLFVAIDLANATAIASFSSNVNIVTSHVNLQVLGEGRGFDERTLLKVMRAPDVVQASPVIEDSIVVGARQGYPNSGEILRVLGIDLLQPLPDGVDVRSNTSDPYGLMDGRGAIVSQRVVDRLGVRVGKTFTALAGGRPVTFTVAAIVPRTVSAADSSVVFVDIVTAQELFGKVGTIDRIDCIVLPQHLQQAKAALAKIIPPGTRVVEPATRTDEVRRLLRSFQVNLAAISLIALLVGAFLIYNTVAISVVQRRAEIGTLRAVGSTRGQIFAVFLAEGALFGVLGSFLGLVFGYFLARLAVAAVTHTVNTLYVGTHVDRVLYDPRLMLEALLFGITVAMISAIAPAIEAAGTQPSRVMGTRGFEPQMNRLAIRLSFGGLLLLGVAYALAQAPAIDGLPLFGYASALCIILGASLCVPLGVIVTARLLQNLGYSFSSAAMLAASNFGGTPRRNSLAIAALAIAVAMIVSVAVSVFSLRATVAAWLDQTLKADLFVRPMGVSGEVYDARIPAKIPERIRALPGVAAVDTFRGVEIPFRGSLITFARTDFRTIGERDWVHVSGGADAATLARTLPGTTRVIVSAPFAEKANLHPGDSLVLDTPAGPTSFVVAAIYDDYSNDAGTVLVDQRTFNRLYHDDSAGMFSVYAKPGTDLNALRTKVIRAALPLRVEVQTTRDLRAVVFAIFDRTFLITQALNIIAITIAVMGVVSTLFALVLERRREIGVLRYLGLTIRSVRHMVLYEATLIGALGGAFGIGAGMLLGLLLIYVIDRQAFGWPMHLHVPYWPLAESLLLVMIAAILAGLYPAQVAARIATADAVRTE
ncbi:MAG TPA: FtsX-like permease family protein [Candidatus Rubrimentiphilum sp.]|nr:FtsX-like permease family protein [Candidatus Rubrimentiphilum sp.]